MMHANHTSRGFTLAELLIVLGIFALMSGVVLSNYRSYNTNALFANASEDVALALRQAQVYGAGAKANTSACGGLTTFDCSYGVYFSKGANGISIFADVNQDRVYKAIDDNPIIQSINWGNSISISSLLCGGLECNTASASVTFKRPNPDAYISDIPVLVSTVPSPYNEISIVIKDANTGKTATTTITRSGQISLQ